METTTAPRARRRTPEARGHGGLGERGDSKVNVGRAERVASSVLGGAMAVWGARRGDWKGAALVASAAGLLHRGVTGHCVGYNALRANTALHGDGERLSEARHTGFDVSSAITIGVPLPALRRFLRDPERLVSCSPRIRAISPTAKGLWRWRVELPLIGEVTWIAAVAARDEERLEWRTAEGSDIAHTGVASFRPAPQDRGTEVLVRLTYNAPGGRLGHAAGKLAGGGPRQWLRDELRAIKRYLETGEVARLNPQPSARMEDR